MKKFVKEFKEFISRGNVMDLAVGVIIGGAFTAIVTSLTDNIINPLISMIGGNADVKGLTFTFNGATIDFGAFISSIINFLIIAFVVFCLVKSLNKMQALADKHSGRIKEEAAPAPICPYCLEEIKQGATKCPHCGADLH